MTPSRVQLALREEYNLGALAIAGAASLALLNPLPILVALGAEAIYLLTVPDSNWYAELLKKRDEEKLLAHRKQLEDDVLQRLDMEMRERYGRLRDIREELNEQVHTSSDAHWYEQVFLKLDALLEQFLIFAYRDAQGRQYLQDKADDCAAANEEYLDNRKKSEVDDLRARLAATTLNYSDPTARWAEECMKHVRLFHELQTLNLQQLLDEEIEREKLGQGDFTTRQTLERRQQVLVMALEDIKRTQKSIVTVNQQIQLFEETFNLIEGKVRSKVPGGQILGDLDEVINQAHVLQSALEEVSAYRDDTVIQQHVSVGS